MVGTVWGLWIVNFPSYFLQNHRVAVDLSLASGVHGKWKTRTNFTSHPKRCFREINKKKLHLQYTNLLDLLARKLRLKAKFNTMKILINFATSQMLLSLTSGFLLSYRPRGATFLQPKRTIKDSVLFAENRRTLLQNIASFGALASQGMLLTSGSEKASALVEGNPVPKKAKALPGK